MASCTTVCGWFRISSRRLRAWQEKLKATQEELEAERRLRKEFDAFVAMTGVGCIGYACEKILTGLGKD